ncbi:GGDEF domain-containing protein [Actinoplanes sp. NEAU-A12]|uniref:GGDEF domain-containing protein n=1 Tax=Actinoplanes sandaracinus TaxID=3045177 RepID=A0ABT6WR51_9ACTN|nr:GGDEF domain-containing protein [Actinoplanes sandaracinus]MDI6102210.1 GGDEF domain-containing protein [Actinoplanes sandaracinus]
MHTGSRLARRRHPGGGLPPVYLAAGALYAVVLALSAVNLFAPVAWYESAAEAARFAFAVFGLVAAVRAARMPQLPPRLRQAWGAVAACFSALVVAVPLLMVLGVGGAGRWDDATHVVFVVALLIALQRFPLAPTSRRDRLKAAVDALTVMAGGLVVLWYTAIGPLLERTGFSADVMLSAAVYPLGDLALLFSAVRALLRGADESAQRPLRLLTAGALILFTGDAVHGYLSGHDGAEMPASWQFICWITADALLAAAAVAQGRAGFVAVAAGEPRRALRAGRYLPFLAVAVAHLLMLAQAWQDGRFFPWGGLALGGAMLSVLVLYRQTLAQRESDERALTDGLTGLANRSLFRQASCRALGRGRRAAILVIDMNGFKEINDTLGHQTGDRVLVEFAEVLRRCVPRPGLPARLGGDEFAVVLPEVGRPEEAYEVAGRLAGALGQVVVDGRLLTLAASIGVAVTEPGELTHDEIVHRADLAMYKAKSMGPDTRWAIWHESLEPSAPVVDLAAA